jgi:hypothetical protein
MFRFLEDISPNQHLLAAGLGLPLFAALLTSLLRTPNIRANALEHHLGQASDFPTESCRFFGLRLTR